MFEKFYSDQYYPRSCKARMEVSKRNADNFVGMWNTDLLSGESAFLPWPCRSAKLYVHHMTDWDGHTPSFIAKEPDYITYDSLDMIPIKTPTTNDTYKNNEEI